MRLAFVCYRGSMTSGGQGIYLYALTRELARQGHSIDVFVGPPYPSPLPWARVFELPNERFWTKRFEATQGAFLPQPDPWKILEPLNFYEFAVTRFGFFPETFAFSVRAARAIQREMRNGAGYRLVHDVQSMGYGLLWLQAHGVPVVSTIHHPLAVDLRSSLARDRSFRERVGSLTFHPVRTQRRVAKRLAGVITSSEASRRQIANDFGVPATRIHNVRNGVEFPQASGIRKPPEPPQLLFVGRAGDPNKGLEYLLDALAELPTSVELRCLSERPWPGEPAFERLLSPDLASRVRFEGKLPRGELEAAYRAASIVVLPSIFEGFGLPAIEALAAGTPVIATDAGALPEVLGVARAGQVVAARDPRALARAIDATLDNWEEAQRGAVGARTAEVYARIFAQGAGADRR